MSYAEQFFGTKQNLVLQYAENLAFFGEESYVYKNASLMKEVIANKVALSNPTTAYYAYLWARTNGYKAIDLFNTGLVIAVYNSELNTTYHFVLIDFNDDGSAVFFSRESCIFMPSSNVTNGLDVLNYEDYEIVQYLNNDVNWYAKWENKPASNTQSISNITNPLRALRNKNGFLSGFNYKFKSMLKTFKEGYNFLFLPISYEDRKNSTFVNLGYHANVYSINENVYNFYINNITGQPVSSVKLGGKFYGCLIEEVTADQIEARPTYRAGWTSDGGAVDMEYIQTHSDSYGCAPITSSCPHSLKIQF